jgi:hypothetical protein
LLIRDPVSYKIKNMNDEERDVRTDFLYARPSFWSGIGRVLDLWGKFDDYNTSQTPDEADMRALYCDWRVVGQGIRDSWAMIHDAKSAHPKIKRKDGRVACLSCGKSGSDYSIDRKAAAQPANVRLHLKHGREQER